MHVSTFLMFQDGNARKALTLYSSVFPDLEIGKVEHHEAEDETSGIKTAQAQLHGHRLILSDSPIPHDFDFTPSVSIFIDFDDADTQQIAFERLSEDGEVMMPLDDHGFSQRFGWVQDRFGVSWQLNLSEN